MHVAIDAPRLVVILPIEGIPTIVGIHEGLPSLEEILQVCKLPAARFELIVCAMIDIHMLKVEDHVNLMAVKLDGFENLLLILDKRHLAHAEGIVLLQNLPESLEILVQPGSIGVPFITPLPRCTRILDRCVEEALVFADEVDHIHAETITALVQPESHNIVNCIANRWVLPV